MCEDEDRPICFSDLESISEAYSVCVCMKKHYNQSHHKTKKEKKRKRKEKAEESCILQRST